MKILKKFPNRTEAAAYWLGQTISLVFFGSIYYFCGFISLAYEFGHKVGTIFMWELVAFGVHPPIALIIIWLIVLLAWWFSNVFFAKLIFIRWASTFIKELGKEAMYEVVDNYRKLPPQAPLTKLIKSCIEEASK